MAQSMDLCGLVHGSLLPSLGLAHRDPYTKLQRLWPSPWVSMGQSKALSGPDQGSLWVSITQSMGLCIEV